MNGGYRHSNFHMVTWHCDSSVVRTPTLIKPTNVHSAPSIFIKWFVNLNPFRANRSVGMFFQLFVLSPYFLITETQVEDWSHKQTINRLLFVSSKTAGATRGPSGQWPLLWYLLVICWGWINMETAFDSHCKLSPPIRSACFPQLRQMRSGLQWMYGRVERKRVERSSGPRQVVTSVVKSQWWITSVQLRAYCLLYVFSFAICHTDDRLLYMLSCPVTAYMAADSDNMLITTA